MTTARTWPYLRATPERVRDTGWFLETAEAHRALGAALGDWDPATGLRLSRTLYVDTAGIREDCRLPAEAALRVTASWRSGGTSLRGRGSREELRGGGIAELSLSLDLPASHLATSIILQTSITLAYRLPPQPLVAARPGTILWEDTHDLRLEGSGSRFPMEVMDFVTAGWDFPKRAAWLLEWEPEDLELPVLGGMRLYLNTSHPRVQRLLASPREAESKLILATIQFDVARTLLQSALRNPAFVERQDPWPEESVGRIIRRLVSGFRGENVGTLQRLLETEPARFEAMLQHHMGLFQEL